MRGLHGLFVHGLCLYDLCLHDLCLHSLLVDALFAGDLFIVRQRPGLLQHALYRLLVLARNCQWQGSRRVRGLGRGTRWRGQIERGYRLHGRSQLFFNHKTTYRQRQQQTNQSDQAFQNATPRATNKPCQALVAA